MSDITLTREQAATRIVSLLAATRVARLSNKTCIEQTMHNQKFINTLETGQQ